MGERRMIEVTVNVPEPHRTVGGRPVSTTAARLVDAPGGGYVTVMVSAVHTHACPNWRMGRRHGPCTCGAAEAWQGWLDEKLGGGG